MLSVALASGLVVWFAIAASVLVRWNRSAARAGGIR